MVTPVEDPFNQPEQNPKYTHEDFNREVEAEIDPAQRHRRTDEKWKVYLLNNFIGRFPGGFYRFPENLKDDKLARLFQDIDQEIQKLGLSPEEILNLIKNFPRLTNKQAQDYIKIYIAMRNLGYQRIDLVG